MATKKISELPLITTLSGSQVDGGSVLPVVVGGTTNQISVENFSRFATAYSATTASNNFLGTQNITGNVNITGVETVTGTLNVVGGGSVSGDFSVGGKLTVQELHTEVTSASVLFESGSTILGNTADDTHTVTGTILLNGQALGTGQLNAYTGSLLSQTTLLSTFTSSINLATASLNLQTGSQDLVNRRISSTTGSINTTTSSFDSVFLRISSTTGSINTTTSSFNSVFLGISSVTGAMNTQSSSQDLVNLAISTYTGSQNIINSSVDSHILKQASQTGSQDLVNLGISSVTGSLIGITNGLMAFTSALDDTYATDAQLYQLYQATASIQAFTSSQDTRNFTISQITSSIDAHILKQAIQTGSQDLVNLGISSVTGSLIGITNGLMAFTAALDSTYATDAQLYQLYQATASLNTQTGSQNTINFNISVVTSSIDGHILKQAIQTGSQDLVNLGISTYTGSQNVINTSVDSHILKQAIQTGSQDLVNLGISTFTGSLRSEVNLIEAYTASLKGAAIVSSSQQVQNYNLFAYNTITSSAATTFYGKVSIATTQSSAPLTVKEQGTGGAVLFRYYGNISNGDYMRGYWTSQDGVTGLAELTVNGNVDMIVGTSTTAPLKLYTNSATAVEINYLAGANFVGAVTASNFKVPSGGGIDFSATSNSSGTTSSELLNDYEEGTWVIGIEFGGASAGVTTSTNTGTYTKIGRQVTVNGGISLTSKGSSTGAVEITGLPFTIGAGAQNHPPASIWLNNVTFANQYQARGLTSGVKVRIEEITEAGVLTNVDDTNFANNSEIFISLTYFV